MEKNSRQEKKKTEPVLKGYKRIRKRFVPPLLQLPGITETNYVNDCLPQVIWMSLLNNAFGPREGTQLALDLAERAHSLRQSRTAEFLNFALCDSYGDLTSDESSSLTEQLAHRGTLKQYQLALAPLLGLHPACPMRLTEFAADQQKETWIRRLGEAVFSIYDRRSPEASLLSANIFAIRGMTGGMFFPKDFEVPNFDALISAPDSEEAQAAASFARAAAMNESVAGGEVQQSAWCAAFWNQNATIDECLFWVQEGEDTDDSGTEQPGL